MKNILLDTLKREIAKRQTTYPKIIEKERKNGASDDEIFNLQVGRIYKISLLEMLCDFLISDQMASEEFYNEIHDELKWEMKMRKKHYPRFILFKRITKETADLELKNWAALIEFWENIHSGYSPTENTCKACFGPCGQCETA